MDNYLRDVLYLNEDPFKIGVPEHPEIWAGSEDIKRDLERMIGNMLVSESSTLNVIWGILGTGKTYSSKYFYNKGIRNVLEELQKGRILDEFDFFCFPPFTTTIGGMRDIQFFDMLLNEIGLNLRRSDRAKEIFEKALSGDDSLVNSFIETSILSYQFKSVIESGINPDELFQKISESFLPSDPPLSLTRIPYILETFIFILKILSHPEYGFKRIFIWIDEVEKFEQMPRVEWQTNNNFLRDYVDKILEKVHVMLLITTARRDVAELRQFLDDPVRRRLTYVFELTSILEENQAIQYVEQLLYYYRSDNAPGVLSSTFPFERDCVRKLITESGTYQAIPPRGINIVFQKALASLRREAYQINPDEPITFEQLKEIMVT